VIYWLFVALLKQALVAYRVEGVRENNVGNGGKHKKKE
jgi:hypothetical protein